VANYHEVNFVVEAAVAPPKNPVELRKVVEGAYRRWEES